MVLTTPFRARWWACKCCPEGGRPSPSFALSSPSTEILRWQDAKLQDLTSALRLRRRPAEGECRLQADDSPLDSGHHHPGLSGTGLAHSGWELTLQEVWHAPRRWLMMPRWQIFVELWAGRPLTQSLGSLAFVWNRFPPVFSPQTGRSTEGLLSHVPSPWLLYHRWTTGSRLNENLNMRCTCCLLILTLWSAAAGCNNRMPMCIGSFSLHSKWIGLSKRDPNLSVIRLDVYVPAFRERGLHTVCNRDIIQQQ